MEEIRITLINDAGEENSFAVEQVFQLEGSEQLYCCAVAEDSGDIVFLRCAVNENGDNAELEIFYIPDEDEYDRVAAAYLTLIAQEKGNENEENLADEADIFTATDKDGNEVHFIGHTIFEDETTHREYIAVQEISETGDVAKEIALYRFQEKDDTPVIEMIPSDMEYERARTLFQKLIETE